MNNSEGTGWERNWEERVGCGLWKIVDLFHPHDLGPGPELV